MIMFSSMSCQSLCADGANIQQFLELVLFALLVKRINLRIAER